VRILKKNINFFLPVNQRFFTRSRRSGAFSVRHPMDDNPTNNSQYFYARVRGAAPDYHGVFGALKGYRHETLSSPEAQNALHYIIHALCTFVVIYFQGVGRKKKVKEVHKPEVSIYTYILFNIGFFFFLRSLYFFHLSALSLFLSPSHYSLFLSLTPPPPDRAPVSIITTWTDDCYACMIKLISGTVITRWATIPSAV
jgi:uncharacterized membrane protein YgdD (TMEM256/DUF423 family)